MMKPFCDNCKKAALTKREWDIPAGEKLRLRITVESFTAAGFTTQEGYSERPDICAPCLWKVLEGLIVELKARHMRT